MRPVTKVILVLSVVALAVGVIWFATYQWGGAHTTTPAIVSTPLPAPTATAPVVDRTRPAYNDPLTTYERWREHLTGRGEPGVQPPAVAVRRPPNDVTSTSEREGTVVARMSEEPVAGADPPGPTLRTGSLDGVVVTRGWTTRDPAGGNMYTIASGDTLAGISQRLYGDARYASAIEAANQGINPRALKIGQQIVIPDKTAVVRPPAAPAVVAPGAPTPAAPAAPQTKVYEVQKNDTLIGVARRIYGDAAMYRKIYEANQDILTSPNATLRVGQRLRLPEL
jgi:LysM repeat protein